MPTASPLIRLVLVEDHAMVAEAIALALARAPGIAVVAHAATIAAALTETARTQPDVVVLDRRLPDGDGIPVIGRLAAAAPRARVLVLTGEATAAVAVRVVQSGGAGLLVKSSRLDELESAVREVAAGGMVFPPGLLPGVFDRLTGRSGHPGSRLTPRERETLLLLAEGAGTVEISERLGVARTTARNHVQHVLEKLGARSKLEAVAVARREGLLD
ncbi:response regulator transcription factor [Nonomuraea wenchangensis]|uniref:DNA-binding response regulator, NarL/FixJ family, contains REC and HTH domains n=1 Tax=Nonomuraea wenchangensis TaxID=568860 RepID=A0A1I0K816_9ACTN|nr:response regulator transcription factor [Nonomuraea wenchangensis]SEU20073.1 DNA-binding response regulator, NarL/FixJ family, contains REC and HTH domains [Nonomuraea wenchangensis]